MKQPGTYKFKIHRTGTYKYTLLAENNEGNDSKTVEVTVLGKDSMPLNFIQCIYCGSILSLVQILFSFVSNSLTYITIPQKNGK